MCGSWSSTLQSLLYLLSSSSPANSKTELMTVGSEEDILIWCTSHSVSTFQSRWEQQGNTLFRNIGSSWKIIKTNYYFLVYSIYLHFVYIVSDTVENIQWNAVIPASWIETIWLTMEITLVGTQSWTLIPVNVSRKVFKDELFCSRRCWPKFSHSNISEGG